MNAITTATKLGGMLQKSTGGVPGHANHCGKSCDVFSV
jgi:hypothetical protein